MPLNTDVLTSLILVITADGVSGGVRRRSERVVVCDFKTVVVFLSTSNGFDGVFVVLEDDVSGAWGLVDGVREDGEGDGGGTTMLRSFEVC